MTVEQKVEQTIAVSMAGARLESLDVSLMDMNPVQPPLRSTEQAIQTLKDRILKSKIITPIMVVEKNGRYIILDGHRRYVAVRGHGLTTIPAIVLQGVNPIDAFIDLGYATKNFTGATWFTIWSKSGDETDGCLNRCSATIRGKVLKMVKVFGRARAMDLGRDGVVSPGAADLIVKLYEKRLGDHEDIQATVTIRQVGEWVLKHKCQRAIEDQERVRSGYTKKICQDIVRWIKNDEPWGGK